MGVARADAAWYKQGARMLLLRASEGELMDGDTRNTKVVVWLILAMTAGAAILLWLEPGPNRPTTAPPLTAIDGMPVEDVVVRFADAGSADVRNADCVILPDGRWDWRPNGPHVSLVVVGSDDPGELADPQKRLLLSVLGGMTQGRGGDVVRVRLHPDSDTRARPELPRQARELREFLVWKGLIE